MSGTSKPQIFDNVLETIGNSPLIRMNKIAKAENLDCELLAKWEGCNPGGSVKDRIALRMVLDAEKSGKLQPGGVIISYTSGNTGLALAMVAAVREYQCVLLVNDKFGIEKLDIASFLGASIIRTSGVAKADASPDGEMALAKQLHSIIPNSVILDQFEDPANILAHYDTTAEEIYEACNGKVDYVVGGIGTAGTMCGLSLKLKEKIPNIQTEFDPNMDISAEAMSEVPVTTGEVSEIVAADPYYSILAPGSDPRPPKSHSVEGIGVPFHPKLLNYELIDEWINVTDEETFNTARRVIKEEGILIAMAAAIKIGKRLSKGERIVVIQPDNTKNYMSSLIRDSWMESKKLHIERKIQPFMEVSIQNNIKSKKPLLGHDGSSSIEHAITCLKEKKLSVLAIQDKSGFCIGLATLGNMEFELEQKVKEKVADCMYPSFGIVRNIDTIEQIVACFKHYPFVILTKDRSNGKSVTVDEIEGIIDPLTFYEFLNKWQKEQTNY